MSAAPGIWYSPATTLLDDRIELRIAHATGHALLPEVGECRVRLGGVLAGRLQQRHQVLCPIVGRQRLADPRGQEQFLFTNLADNLSLRHRSIVPNYGLHWTSEATSTVKLSLLPRGHSTA